MQLALLCACMCTHRTQTRTTYGKSTSVDAIVIGAGPNGLAAAIELSRSGRAVRIYEANATVGGGARSAELTLPGFIHDTCSAVHPLTAGSAFFSALPLERYGLEFIHSPIALAHPFDDGTAAILDRSIQVTSENLGRDGAAYRNLVTPLVERWQDLAKRHIRSATFSKTPIPRRAIWHSCNSVCKGIRR